MRLVHRIGVIVTELLDDLFGLIELFRGSEFSNDTLKTATIVSIYKCSNSGVHGVYSNAPTFLLS